MEVNRGQNGIQQLLAAEQEAQHIVNAARNGKLSRLKQAKEEAEKESRGDSGANMKRFEQETQAKMHHLKNEATRISYEVIQMLLKHVITVKN
ncbi:Vacuolar (H+)-ATPase G subunit [Parasponia andersonii]|uniref:Vacuolar (H+)-ATPase G subunit n=1 Tax=Parasponia andersonii TaxID=3476 RepID=A0A2P5AC34_PARAD|nr:Vacuolar (H+)-ATPase G subunit [Parasponia andersonii]